MIAPLGLRIETTRDFAWVHVQHHYCSQPHGYSGWNPGGHIICFRSVSVPGKTKMVMAPHRGITPLTGFEHRAPIMEEP